MIYFAQVIADQGPIKIGYTAANAPDQRLSDLQVACPYEVRLLHTTEGTEDEERALHREFAYARMRGEWFMPVQPLIDFIEMLKREDDPLSEIPVLERVGQVSFTMRPAYAIRRSPRCKICTSPFADQVDAYLLEGKLTQQAIIKRVNEISNLNLNKANMSVHAAKHVEARVLQVA